MTAGDTLVALMEKDLAIVRAEKALDELPEKVAILQLRRRLKEVEDVHTKAEAYRRKADSMVARSNDEIAAVQSKMEAEQARILSGEVTNPKELQNISRELEALGRRKDVLERETLGLMEKAETGAGQVGKVEATLAEGHEKEARLIERFKEKGGGLQSEIEHLRKERKHLAATLDAALLGRYEALREAKHGIGVGVYRDGMCSACRTKLPADRAQAVESGPEITECPECKRILVVGRAGA